MTAYGTIEDAVAAMKQGAYDFITKPFDTEHLCVLVNRALENRRLVAENTLLRQELLAEHGITNIIGKNEKMLELGSLVQKVAKSDASVLLQGESGTGKELFARAIHKLSLAQGRTVYHDQLRRHSRRTAGKRIVRFREGSVHRRARAQDGQVRNRQRAGRSSSTKSATWISPCRPNSCACFSRRTSSGSAGTKTVDVDVRVIAATNMDLQELIAPETVPRGPVLSALGVSAGHSAASRAAR